MLQQTQAMRVVPKYEAFLRRFPTARALAKASLKEVLKTWQGLGYNRRAKYLHEAAKLWGRVPLEALPGVGEYTAKAIRVFAWNKPEIMIETNIRSVFLYHFFPHKKKIPDSKIVPYMELCINKRNPRAWYWTLMDYGAYLKQTVPNPSRRSAHHVRQKPFKGSNREIRGAILRAFVARRRLATLPFDKERLKVQLARLRAEGLLPR